MVHREDLDKLKTFGREKDGTYCNRDNFSLILQSGICHIHSFCEVNGIGERLASCKDFEELSEIYYTLSYKELE